MNKLPLEELLKRLILEKTLPLNLSLDSIRGYAHQLRKDHSLSPNLNEDTFLVIFNKAYNKTSSELKKTYEKEKFQESDLFKKIKLSSNTNLNPNFNANSNTNSNTKHNSNPLSLKDYIGIESITEKLHTYFITPLKNLNSFTSYDLSSYSSFNYISKKSISKKPALKFASSSLSYKSLLITGPEGVGKKFLATCACSEIKRDLYIFNFLKIFDSFNNKSKFSPLSKSFIKSDLNKEENINENLENSIDIFKEIRNSIILIENVFKPKNSEESISLYKLFQKINEDDFGNFFIFTSQNRANIPSLFFSFENLSSTNEILISPLQNSNLRFSFLLSSYKKIFDDENLLRLKKQTQNYLKTEISQKTRNFTNRELLTLMRNAFLLSFKLKPQINVRVSLSIENLKHSFEALKPLCRREGFSESPSISLNDIGGLSKVKRSLQESILLPLKYWRKFKALNFSSGILLHGPPGCGKTMLAKAIAAESSASFIMVKGPEFINLYLGESERAVRTLFERARAASPCVIFFDEIDSICSKRSGNEGGSGGGGGNGAAERIVNQLLTEMDSICGGENGPVFVIGATNRIESIDRAFLRQGRLGKKIFVGLPSLKERKEIFEVCRKKYFVDEKIDFEKVLGGEKVCEMEKVSGADICEMFKIAYLKALFDYDKINEVGSELNDLGEMKSEVIIKKKHLKMAIDEINKYNDASYN